MNDNTARLSGSCGAYIDQQLVVTVQDHNY